jgi:multidrug efflux pump subunit AcrA (membrane-fusion protein)
MGMVSGHIPVRSNGQGPAFDPGLAERALDGRRVDEYALRVSPEIEGVLAEAPRWPVQWGGLIMLGVIAAAVALGWFVRYPELVTAPLTLTTAAAPVAVRAPADGRLDTLLAADKAPVVAGQPLAILENAARTEDVRRLRAWLGAASVSRVPQDRPRAMDEPPGGLVVGAAQDAYVRLLTRVAEYNVAVLDTVIEARLRALEVELREQRGLEEIIVARRRLADREIEIARRAVERQRTLRAQHFSTDTDVEVAELELLRRQSLAAEIEASFRAAAVRRAELRATMLSIVQQRRDALTNRLSALAAAVDEARHAILLWEEAFVMRAPIAGQVSFLSFVRPHSSVRRGEEVFGLVPDSTGLRAEALMPQVGSGSVRPGQRARLAFASYPVRDVGYVEGIVQDIGLLPRDSVLLVRIALPHGLRASYGGQLTFQQQMRGVAEIVTGETNIIRRIANSAKLIRDRH